MALPSEYRKLDYIESTGTQYIYSNIRFESSWTFKLHMMMTEYSSNGQTFFGNAKWYPRDVVDTDSMSVGENSHMLQSLYAGTWSSSGPTITLNVPHTIYSKKVDSKYNIYLDNEKSFISWDWKDYTTKFGMGIFVRYDKLGLDFAISKIKLFRLTFYNNEECVHDLIPVLRVSDSKPGLYDLVSDEFYINSGTNEFLYGSIVSDTSNIFFEDNPLIIDELGGEAPLTANLERAASLRYKVNGVWKYAIPYIKINGNWYKAIAYRKTNGVWKQGI